MNFRWLTMPKSNETKEVPTAYMWEVRWRSRNGEFYSDTRPEVEAFTTRELADEFVTSLRNAFKLLRHKGSGTEMSVKRKGETQS
jgi:hypothetical protein